MAREYYFLSDLHLGGDGELQHCDYADELIAFLASLTEKAGDIELVIAGDTFGLWELTTVDGPAKLDEIVAQHEAIFAQLRETGARITITLMVGNHDYDLACDPAFGERLAAYNLRLDTEVSLRRELLGKTLWIEHGQQADPFNASPDYGNLYALPVGYFITETIVAGASRLSAFGRGNWLKDIRSVATEQIPDWMASNYFYREMAWPIRTLLTVFLSLITVTAFALLATILQATGALDVNFVLDNALLRSLGFVGNVLIAIILVNMLILFFMIAVAIPGFFVLRDLMKTLRRFRVSTGVGDMEGMGRETYLRRAREVFAENPDAAVYLFGHTHDAFLSREPDGRTIINMGTWLKILDRVPVRFGYLPAVYFPSFRLNYFHIAADDGDIVIRYVEVAKTPEQELGWLQRLVTLGKHRPEPTPIPEITRVEVRR